MKKISEIGRLDAAQPQHEPEKEKEHLGLARRLLGALAPLSPAISSQTRDPAGARVWLDSWARQIAAADLGAADLAAGLARIHTIPPSQPLGWQQFYQCCRPQDQDVRAADLEARRRNLPGLPDEATKQRRIEAARRALADPRISKFLHRVSPGAE